MSNGPILAASCAAPGPLARDCCALGREKGGRAQLSLFPVDNLTGKSQTRPQRSFPDFAYYFPIPVTLESIENTCLPGSIRVGQASLRDRTGPPPPFFDLAIWETGRGPGLPRSKRPYGADAQNLLYRRTLPPLFCNRARLVGRGFIPGCRISGLIESGLNRLRKNSNEGRKGKNWGIENHQATLADRSLSFLARSIFALSEKLSFSAACLAPANGKFQRKSCLVRQHHNGAEQRRRPGDHSPGLLLIVRFCSTTYWLLAPP